MKDAFQRGFREELQKLAAEDLEKRAFIQSIIPSISSAISRAILTAGGRTALRGARRVGGTLAQGAATGAAMQAGGTTFEGNGAVSRARNALFGGFGYQSNSPGSVSMPNVSPLGTPTPTIRPPAPVV